MEAVAEGERGEGRGCLPSRWWTEWWTEPGFLGRGISHLTPPWAHTHSRKITRARPSMTGAHKAHCSPPGPLPGPFPAPASFAASSWWQAGSLTLRGQNCPPDEVGLLPLLICCPLSGGRGKSHSGAGTGTLSLRHGTHAPTCQLPTPHTLPHSRSCSGWSALHYHLRLLFSQKSLKRSVFLHGKLMLSTVSWAFIPAYSSPPVGSLLGLPISPPTYSF